MLRGITEYMLPSQEQARYSISILCITLFLHRLRNYVINIIADRKRTIGPRCVWGKVADLLNLHMLSRYNTPGTKFKYCMRVRIGQKTVARAHLL